MQAFDQGNSFHVLAVASPSQAIRAACIGAMLAVLLVMPVHGDSVRIDGFWFRDVEIQNIDGEYLTYTTAIGGEVEQAVSGIQGIEITALPGYQQAVAMIEAGQAAQAVTLLETTLRQARTNWQRILVNWQLLNAAKAAEQAVPAYGAYVRLGELGADTFFLGDPPVQLAQKLSDDQRRVLADQIRPLVPRVAQDLREDFQELLASVEAVVEQPGTAAPAGPGTPPATDTTRPTTAPRERPGRQPAAQVVWAGVLPDGLRLTNVVDLMRAGEFEQAAGVVRGALSNPNDLPEKLYLLGMCQLQMAAQQNDPELYKDAAISFMRVVVHFPEGHRLRIPALTEVAYAHHRFGRTDRAREILSQRVRPVITDDMYPRYYERFTEVSELIGTP